MAKKQFIRHLEFYGFPDQNKYAGFGDIDLSDIREKNKEQDEEIQDLEGEKAEKKDLDELSGTVENLIAAQAEVNEAFADAISGMSGDIDELAEEVSALTDTVNDVIDDLEDLSASTNFNIAELRQGFNAYTRYADMEFAHRNNVYTKQEIDDMFASGCTSGCATVEWVEEQGFLTEESGDTLYVRLDDFDVYSGKVESALTELTEAIVAVDEKVDNLSGEAFSAITTVQNNLNEYSIYADSRFAHKDDVDSLVDGIEDEIQFLSGKVDTNTTNIDWCSRELAKKAPMSALTETRLELLNDIRELDEKKADKTDISALSGAIDSNKAAIEAEKISRREADDILSDRIVDLGERVAEAEETVSTYDARITNVESGLTKEIADREQADLGLIGTDSDDVNLNTIWAAKNLAISGYNDAVEEANAYTDNRFGLLEGEFIQLSAATDSALTQFATTGYVEQRIQETLSGESLWDDLQREIEERKNGDEALSGRCDELEGMYSGLSKDVSHAINQLGALTEWDGENPEEYEPWSEEHPGANGIVDVLHREFHEFEQTHGTIKSIEIKDGNLIITYMTTDGERQEIVPITDILVLDGYYKKEETDALLAEKLDVSAYTEDIEAISGDVVNLDAALAALIEKLGYKDNDTLVTNGEHEVAFGEYNISHESEEPSGQTVFSVGIGTDDANRSNAVEIMKNGDLYLWVEGEFMNVNKLLGQIAHEIYDKYFFDGD